MKREEFINAVRDLVARYISEKDSFGEFAHLRVNPALLTVAIDTSDQFQQDIADSDEAIEEAAYAEGDENESATDYQNRQNPDYYLMSRLVRINKETAEPDMKAIDRVAANYFK